ncbi:serine/threonine-protein kinase greatwall [Folsomia candida]|uniref:Serine/threonine-protein kinase greatwall n=1 Tax=Folsomia candida TaxID=158441 RepID=A0A226EG52_FOLCA|nr:serine/threonine-protein kinase greatwall [Folsomia candida]XP_021951002.1 serine/threonine-protein kinase greatwall [Folsomia candida]OXA55761.1 Serine/threonine-protein kinase greatwall [Folsomia candida]
MNSALPAPTTNTLLPPSPQHLPGISDFTIIKPISRGAFGKVFLGHRNTSPDTLYAIKAMRKEDLIMKNSVEKVVKERDAQVLAGSSDPFCVKLFYSLQTKNYIYLVMEYCIGGDLKSLLNRMVFFPLKMVAFYVAEIAVALDFLHKNGVVHRDIKPDNLLLDGRGHIKLTDFGLSRVELGSMLSLSPGKMRTCFTPGQIASLKANLTFSKVQFEAGMNVAEITHRTPCASTPRRLRVPLRTLRLQQPPTLEQTPPPKSQMTPLAKTPEFVKQTIFTTGEWSIIHTPKGPKEKRARIEGDDSSFINLSFTSSTSGSPPIPLNKLGLEIMHSSPLQERNRDGADGALMIPNFGGESPVVASCANRDEPSSGSDKNLVFSPEGNFADRSDYHASFSSNDNGCLNNSIVFPSSASGNFSVDFSNYKLDEEGASGHLYYKDENLVPPAIHSTTNLFLHDHRLQSSSSAALKPESLINLDAPPQLNELDKIDESQQGEEDESYHHPRLYHSLGERSPEIGRLCHTEKASIMRHSHFHGFHEFHSNHGRSSRNCNLNLSPPLMMPQLLENIEMKRDHQYHHHNNYASTSLTSFTSGKRKRWTESTSCGKSNLTLAMTLFEINKECSLRMIGLSSVDKSLSMAATAAAINTTPAISGSPNNSVSDKNIIGTPDYLAPELILQQGGGHGAPVDFWSLGVCFYEFAIGILPFNDDSPQEIFKNIVNRRLEFPDDMDPTCQSCIEGLLEIDPTERLNLKTIQGVRFAQLFEGIKWDNLHDMEAPFIPQPDSPTDVGYFAPRNQELNIEISDLSSP